MKRRGHDKHRAWEQSQHEAAHEVARARCEPLISRAGDGVREGCDHRDEQEARATFIDPDDREFAALGREWPALYQRWQEWLAPLTDDRAQAKVKYHDMKGNPYQQPLWQILLHVVNHGTHHRGQAAWFLRAMGYTPPPLDLIAFYRISIA